MQYVGLPWVCVITNEVSCALENDEDWGEGATSKCAEGRHQSVPLEIQHVARRYAV